MDQDPPSCRSSTSTAGTWGRNPTEVQRTVLVGEDPFEGIDSFLRRMEAYAAHGIEQVWVMPPADDPVGHVARLCDEVLPRLRELG